jgi:hypothetical protein
MNILSCTELFLDLVEVDNVILRQYCLDKRYVGRVKTTPACLPVSMWIIIEAMVMMVQEGFVDKAFLNPKYSTDFFD